MSTKQRRVLTPVRLWLAELLYTPSPPPPGGFIDAPEAFAALNADGSAMCLGYLGEWYFPRKPSIRVRLRNWLVATP